MGKGDSPNSKKGWYRGVSVPGAFKLDHLQPVKPILFPKFFQLFHFHAGRPILITPGRGGLEMGKWISPNLSQAEDFECLGHSNWTICSHLHISDFQNLFKSEVRLG